MAPSSATQKEMLAQIAEATGLTDRNLLKAYLKAAGYNVNDAVDAILDNGAAPGLRASQDAALSKMFDDLRAPDRDQKDSISAESTMTYLSSDLGVNVDNAELFVALEQVQGPSFGEITRKGYVDGWKSANVPANTAAHKDYIRQQVTRLSKDPAYFKKVYRHAFVACKEPDQKALSQENAVVFWDMIFTAPGRPWRTRTQGDWLPIWKAFLKEKWTRSVNKDMWYQTLEFANRVMQDETLSFWSEDGAWPGVVDEFVAWYKDKKAKGEPMEVDE